MLTKLLNTFLITQLSIVPLTAVDEPIGTNVVNFNSYCNDGSCAGTCTGCCADGCAGSCADGCEGECYGACDGTSANHLTNS